MKILGIHSMTHDSGVALCENGKITYAIEEERFSRIKHHPGIEIEGKPPLKSLKWVLEESGLKLNDIDKIVHIGYPGETFLKLDLIKNRFREFAKELDLKGEKTIFVGHHDAHAASAYYASGFEKSIVISIDGAGDWISTAIYIAVGLNIKKVDEYFINQSLGFMYTRAAEILGLGGFGTGEGKLIALAAFGKPIKNAPKIITLNNGRYKLDENYLNWFKQFKCEKDQWQQIHKDFAATVQKILEETVQYILSSTHKKYGIKNVCIGGGVGLNCRMNGKLQKLKWVEKTFVQPAANDSGVCIGAAYLGAVKSGEKKIYPFDSAYLGFNITDKEIENFVKTNNLNGKYIKDIEKYTAEILSKGNIVAWMQSKLEFGPRALGHRSLLGDPRSLIVKDKLNNIKQRESWRPVAPSIVETKKKYHSEGLGSKYMTHAINMNTLAQKEIPGAIHVDGTARIQIVDNENDPYYKLIKQFENITGVPAILNTSLNKKGDPLCCTIEDGIDFFYTTQTDYLIINNWCFSKK